MYFHQILASFTPPLPPPKKKGFFNLTLNNVLSLYNLNIFEAFLRFKSIFIKNVNYIYSVNLKLCNKEKLPIGNLSNR